MTYRHVTRRWRVPLAATAVLGSVLLLAPPAFADQVRDAQWHLSFLKVDQAHRITKGAGVTVAVIDTGVDAGHPDLRGAVLAGADFAILKADKPDGRTDTDGHGTAMAGLIAGRGRTGHTGALGIAPEAKILPVRDANNRRGASSSTHEAIQWAVEHGAKVVNMSFTGEDDTDLAAAISNAVRADVVLVAGAGNRPSDAVVGFPAAYPGVIAAGGVDRRGDHADFSVAGPELGLAAPAVDIMSTNLRGGSNKGYVSAGGTSNASAIIAGAAALVRARYPDLSATEVVHRLTATATDKGPKGRDPQYGYGVLNLVAALTADVPPLPATSTAPAAGPGTAGPGGPPLATPPAESTRPTTALLVVGAGCLLLAATIAAAVWYQLRRRRAIGHDHLG